MPPGEVRRGGAWRAGRLRPDERKLFAHLKGGCAQETQLEKKRRACEIISPLGAAVLPPHKEPEAALARFNYYLEKRCLPSPPPFFFFF